MASGKDIVSQACVCNAFDGTSVVVPIEIQEYCRLDDSENEEHGEDGKGDSYTKIQFSQNITLTQKPNEIITVSVLLKWKNPGKNEILVASPFRLQRDKFLSNTFVNDVTWVQPMTAGFDSYDIKLNFHNYIHEISEDYVYTVELNVLKADKEEDHKYHINLFSQEIIRKEKVISITEPPINISLDELRANENFCLKIKRFNKVTSIVKEHPSTNDIGTILLKDGHIYSDVSLSEGEKFFPAHKLILSLKSKVFKRMFAQEMRGDERDIVKIDVVCIDKVEAKVIEEMLNYIYTGKAENLAQLSQDLFKFAIKYEIDDLKAECEEFFIFNLNFENAIDILELARAYELQNLRDKVTAFMSKHEEIMIKEKSYQEFLCRDLTVDRVTSILKLCIKYDLEYVKLKAFEVVKEDKEFFSNNKEFLEVVVSNKNLSKDFISMLLCSFK